MRRGQDMDSTERTHETKATHPMRSPALSRSVSECLLLAINSSHTAAMGQRPAHLATAEPWAWGCPGVAFGTLSEHHTAKLRPLHARSQCLFSSLAALGL